MKEEVKEGFEDKVKEEEEEFKKEEHFDSNDFAGQKCLNAEKMKELIAKSVNKYGLESCTDEGDKLIEEATWKCVEGMIASLIEMSRRRQMWANSYPSSLVKKGEVC